MSPEEVGGVRHPRERVLTAAQVVPLAVLGGRSRAALDHDRRARGRPCSRRTSRPSASESTSKPTWAQPADSGVTRTRLRPRRAACAARTTRRSLTRVSPRSCADPRALVLLARRADRRIVGHLGVRHVPPAVVARHARIAAPPRRGRRPGRSPSWRRGRRAAARFRAGAGAGARSRPRRSRRGRSAAPRARPPGRRRSRRRAPERRLQRAGTGYRSRRRRSSAERADRRAAVVVTTRSRASHLPRRPYEVSRRHQPRAAVADHHEHLAIGSGGLHAMPPGSS